MYACVSVKFTTLALQNRRTDQGPAWGVDLRGGPGYRTTSGTLALRGVVVSGVRRINELTHVGPG